MYIVVQDSVSYLLRSKRQPRYARGTPAVPKIMFLSKYAVSAV